MIASDSGEDYDKYNVTDNRGNYLRTPSGEEFASQQGIPLNPDTESKAKIGKIGKLSELESDDGEGVQGDGAFLWSF